MRLIDADKLHYNRIRIAHSDETIGGYNAVVMSAEIKDAPTVDAVPVVRCKDCKHRPIKPDDYNPFTTDGFALEFPDEKCPCRCDDGWYSKYPDDNWFCADGEHKGEDE